ncbi:MAG: hypothetical protein NTZ69_15895 [Bacteroidia bacterium]|nr:hypothetical protein [Bacteroidia bacterium]
MIKQEEELREMYLSRKMSLRDISNETGIPTSTIRCRIMKFGFLRTHKDGVKNSIHKWGIKAIGTKRTLTEDWKKNQSIAAKKRWDGKAVGVSLKKIGYIEVTIGENKGKKNPHCYNGKQHRKKTKSKRGSPP